MKKTIFFILSLISILILLIRFTPKFVENIVGIKPKSGLSILSQPTDAVIAIDGNEVGRTPYENKDMAVKEYLIKVEKDQAVWMGKVSLNSGTLTVINRDLSAGVASSSGEILSLEKGRGLTIISNPTGADISVDGEQYGRTPLTININSGKHTILVSRPNFLQRSIRADLPEGYNLTVSVDLALSEADLTTVTTPVISETEEVIVKSTPTGFLRVRDKASTSGKEIGRVKPGDTLVLLEEQDEWMRVRTPEEVEGYVSSEYVEKKESSL